MGDGRDLLVGTSVGKYQIVRVLGSGGMGVLYEARHPVLANRLAIKTLRPTLSLEGPERFRNEALAASRLRDDRLPQIFDVDELPDGTQYIVMEFLEGEDLAHRLLRGALEPGYATRLIFEVLELLAKVHRLGIIHRDIKPANIFIARSTLFGEVPKLLDFGVAHIASATITYAGQMLGTPAYMAPEQVFDSARIGPWTDVFSAAVVLFELIAGRGERPWISDGVYGHIDALKGTAPPRALGAIAPWTPRPLCDAIEQALQRDPARRFQDALAFARAIEPFAVDRSALYQPGPAPPAQFGPVRARDARQSIGANGPQVRGRHAGRREKGRGIARRARAHPVGRRREGPGDAAQGAAAAGRAAAGRDGVRPGAPAVPAAARR